MIFHDQKKTLLYGTESMMIVLSAPQELDQVFGHFQHLQPEISPAKKEWAKNIISQKSYDKIKNIFGHKIAIKMHFGSFDAHTMYGSDF